MKISLLLFYYRLQLAYIFTTSLVMNANNVLHWKKINSSFKIFLQPVIKLNVETKFHRIEFNMLQTTKLSCA